MKRELICLMILLISLGFIAGAQINFQEYYKIDLNYNKGEFKLNNLNIKLSDTSIENYFGFYLAEVIDYGNETLNLTFFDIPNEILYDTVDENGTIVGGGLLELDEVNFSIYAPYYSNADQIIIYNENLTEKLRIDVSMYSKVSKESIEKEREIIPKRIPEEKLGIAEKEPETFTEKLTKIWWILAGVLIILIIILIRGFKKRI